MSAVHLVAAMALAATFTFHAFAQGRQAAVLTARPAEALAAGGKATLTLDVQLPAAIHVQSDKPRDPSLIATALTVTPPAGVTVTAIRYPKASELPQPGRPDPLAVFGPAFSIAVEIAVAADVEAGTLAIPASLRYQACDDRTCFAPARGQVTWSLDVKPRVRKTTAATRTR